MSLVDDLRADTPREQLDRREWLGKITGAALSLEHGGMVRNIGTGALLDQLRKDGAVLSMEDAR